MAAPVATEPPASLPKCYLLALPRELRDTIYELALKRDTYIDIDTTKGRRGQQPWILRVNRQVRRETIPVFYKINYFRLTVEIRSLPAILHNCTSMVGHGRLGPIRRFIGLVYRFEIIVKLAEQPYDLKYGWRIEFAAGRPISPLQYPPSECKGSRACEHCAEYRAAMASCQEQIDRDTETPLSGDDVQNLVSMFIYTREKLVTCCTSHKLVA